ncbi:MAG: hypothetical protein ACKO7A_20130, partial [Microcystis sp.]
PVYQWKVNGNNSGTNAATFTTTTLANNDVVTVVRVLLMGRHPVGIRREWTISMPKPRFESAKLLSDLRQSIFQELALVMTL